MYSLDAFNGDSSAATDSDSDGYPDGFFGNETALSNGNTIDQLQ